jgi:acyl transferase domain-containing protein
MASLTEREEKEPFKSLVLSAMTEAALQAAAAAAAAATAASADDGDDGDDEASARA